MAKRYNTVRECPWCGKMPPAGAPTCKCGMTLPKTSDFEFGLKYLEPAGTSTDDIGMLFAQTCKRAVDGDESVVAELIEGRRYAENPDRWIKSKDGLSILKDAVSHRYKWAEYCLGYLYFKGIGGVLKDYDRSKKLMLSAATSDPVVCVYALRHVCMCYFDGVAGFKRDVDKAYSYYRKIYLNNLKWKTLADMLNRTDLCKNDKFEIGGIPDDDVNLRKKNFEPYLFVETKFDKDGAGGFSFASQTDGRQLMCLIMEATKSFKAKFPKVRYIHNSDLVFLFDEWNELLGNFGYSYSQYSYSLDHEDRPGRRLGWIRDGNGCACFPLLPSDGLKGRGLAFRDVYYYDSMWLGRIIGYDQVLFTNYKDYLNAIAKKADGVKPEDDHGLNLIRRTIVPLYFSYMRRYILSDRKAGVVLWDGSIQKECNAKFADIPILLENGNAKRSAQTSRKVASSKGSTSGLSEKTNQKAEKKEEEAKKKEERAQTRLGCGCLTVIVALVCLVIWGPDWFAGNVAGDILGKIRGVSWDLITLVWIFVSGIAKLMWQHWIISGIIILLFLVYGIK